jgi:hypothetical protein
MRNRMRAIGAATSRPVTARERTAFGKRVRKLAEAAAEED